MIKYNSPAYYLCVFEHKVNYANNSNHSGIVKNLYFVTEDTFSSYGFMKRVDKRIYFLNSDKRHVCYKEEGQEDLFSFDMKSYTYRDIPLVHNSTFL